MNRLWAPWRLSYVTAAPAPSTECIFCDASAGHDMELLLLQGQHSYVILNLYPYNNGHLMVVPKRHLGDLASTTAEERAELMALSRIAEMAIADAYHPHGLNVGINLGRPAGAGVLDHLHIHMVPRWNGDTNFMGVVGNTRVLPEDLTQAVERLRPIFERLAEENHL